MPGDRRRCSGGVSTSFKIAVLTAGATGSSRLLLLLHSASCVQGQAFVLGGRSAASLRECVEICAEDGRVPACITSEAQHAAAAAMVSAVAYTGNVLNASGGVSLCPSGQSTGGFVWDPVVGLFGQPDDSRWASPTWATGIGSWVSPGEVGALEGCMMVHAGGGAEDVACAADRRADCLCEAVGGLSLAFNISLTAREAEEAEARDEDGALLWRVWGVTIAVSVVVEWTVRLTAIAHNIKQAKKAQTIAYISAPPNELPDAEPDAAAVQAESLVDDETSSRAAAKLDAAKESARRVRRYSYREAGKIRG